jgi:hypothetical protein
VGEHLTVSAFFCLPKKETDMSVAENAGKETAELHEAGWTQAVHMVSDALYRLAPKEAQGRLAAGTAIALVREKVRADPDGRWRVQSDKGSGFYIINSHCTCQDMKAPQGRCKHRWAVLITGVAQRVTPAMLALDVEAFAEAVQEALVAGRVLATEPDTAGIALEEEPPAVPGTAHEDEGGDMLTPPPPAPDQTLDAVAETHKVPKEYLQMVHGHPFVLYKGLLAMAHEAGLKELSAEFILVEPGIIALAKAQAVFADGRRFSEAADATPDNVGPTVKEHFARIALTRAKTRTLRDALNVGICSLEELADVSEEAPPRAEPDGWCDKHQCAMKLNHGKDGSTWLSHRLPTGEWCKGH